MKRLPIGQLVLLLCLIPGLFLHGCGGAGSDPLSSEPFRYDPGIPPQVAGVQAASGDQVVTLSWTSQYVATSYNIYYTTSGNGVTQSNSARINVTTNSFVVSGLANNVTYYFAVAAVDKDGEGPLSAQVPSTPGPIVQADLTGTWYFHTLVSGPSARWERGTLVIDGSGNGTFTDFLDSAHYNPVDSSSTPQTLPSNATITVQGDGTIGVSGTGAWGYFQGTMGSRKNMWVGTWTYSADGSKALTVFQKQRATDDYSVQDLAGTGNNQNPNNPNLQGNGPTRFSYHTLNSGSSLEWEYANARIGAQAQFWSPPVSTLFPSGSGSIRDAIYWDYSTPTYKIAAGWDLMWKVTCFGVQQDGLVTEYDNWAQVTDGLHNVTFTGRMTDDKTVIIGVSTKNDIDASQTSQGYIITIPNQYYLRVIDLNFIPTDQSLPTYTVNDLAGTYKFHKIGTLAIPGGSQASWAYGQMQITSSGVTTFPQYADSNSSLSSLDTFTFSYYPDTGSDGHTWTTFANFISPDTGTAGTQYYALNGQPYVTKWTWWNALTTQTQSGSGVRQIPISPYYYNEHATLSYNKDMVVVTRTDAFGYSMIIGLK